MAFANTSSFTASDANNMLRGLHRDNTTYSTQAVAETDLASYTLTGGTMGATGALHIQAAGTTTTATDTKRIRLYFGGTAIIDTTAVTGTSDWWMDAWVYNTSASAQRIVVQWSTHNSATNYNKDYTTLAIDTASNQIIKVTGILANAADTISQTVFDIFVVQIA